MIFIFILLQYHGILTATAVNFSSRARGKINESSAEVLPHCVSTDNRKKVTKRWLIVKIMVFWWTGGRTIVIVEYILRKTRQDKCCDSKAIFLYYGSVELLSVELVGTRVS